MCNQNNELSYDEYLELYADTVTRLCLVHLGNYEDAQDCFQNVFFALFKQLKKEHPKNVKAWLLAVTVNECKKCLRFRIGHRTVNLNELTLPSFDKRESEMLELIMSLSPKYRDVIYLYYYEQYSIKEISSMLKVPVNTVKSHLLRGREQLRRFILDENE